MIEPRDALEEVRADISSVLAELLPPGDDDAGFRVPDGFSFVEERSIQDREGTATVVPWEWTGVNSVGLFGFDPTFRRVTVRGTTIVTEDDGGQRLFRRYIDWLDVLAQSGIVVYSRPLVDVRERYDPDALAEHPAFREALEELAALEREVPPDRA